MKILKLAVLCIALFKPVRAVEECGAGAFMHQKVFTWVAPTNYNLARFGKVEAKHPYSLLAPSHCDVDKFKNIFNKIDFDRFSLTDKNSPLFSKVKKVFEKGFDVGLSELEFLPADEVDAILKMLDQNLKSSEPDCQNELGAAHSFLQYLLLSEAKKLTIY